jgi:hypothetical protein
MKRSNILILVYILSIVTICEFFTACKTTKCDYVRSHYVGYGK